MGGYYSQQVLDQRSVILLGETGAGKSSFGNFLLNRDGFLTGNGMLSTTQKVEQQSCQYTQDNLNIQLHVFDLPGLNDPRKIDTTYLNNTYSALKNCAKCMSTLFAIVINISNREELESTVREIHSFLGKIELPDFNLTDNALLVFSNAHKLGSTRDAQESSLFREIESCPSLYKLWTLVRFRHILVDSVRYTDRDYWLEKMKEIIIFTRPKVRVLLLGPHESAQNDLLKLLRSKKSEMGEPDELPGYDENQLEGVSLEFEGVSLSFEKSVDFLTIGSISECEKLEKNNALTQLTSLIQALTETHTFTAFCVLIRMDTKIKSTFIEGIRTLASAISEDKPDLFYDRCFFLFTHPNYQGPVKLCDRVFSDLSAMKQMKTSMSDRVSILNLQSDSATDVCELLTQTISHSRTMKQKCYGKEYVSNLLSKGFDLSAPPPAPTTPSSSYTPSKLTLGLLALGGGGVIALAGAAAVLLTGGTAAPAVVAPVMLFAVHSSAPVAVPLLAAPVVAGGASVLGGTLGAIGVGANATVASTLFYKLLARNKERKQEREYEYDVTEGSLEYVDS